MADTGENRQITGRANAKEAETVRASRKVVSAERSTVKASDAKFGRSDKGSGGLRKPAQPRRAAPKASKS
jgi:hypothetical protein